jgi:hypothetical protein
LGRGGELALGARASTHAISIRASPLGELHLYVQRSTSFTRDVPNLARDVEHRTDFAPRNKCGTKPLPLRQKNLSRGNADEVNGLALCRLTGDFPLAHAGGTEQTFRRRDQMVRRKLSLTALTATFLAGSAALVLAQSSSTLGTGGTSAGGGMSSSSVGTGGSSAGSSGSGSASTLGTGGTSAGGGQSSSSVGTAGSAAGTGTGSGSASTLGTGGTSAGKGQSSSSVGTAGSAAGNGSGSASTLGTGGSSAGKGTTGSSVGTGGSAAGQTGLDNADKRAGKHGEEGRENARKHQRGDRDRDHD